MVIDIPPRTTSPALLAYLAHRVATRNERIWLLYSPSKSASTLRMLESADGTSLTGAYGVEVEKYEPFPIITDKDLVSPIRTTTPARPVDAPFDFDDAGIQHRKWQQEYYYNPYLCFQTRRQLTQRWHDILNNAAVLTGDGRIDMSQDKIWYRLLQHVIDEGLRRGHPLHEPWNRHVDVPERYRFGTTSCAQKHQAPFVARGFREVSWSNTANVNICEHLLNTGA